MHQHNMTDSEDELPESISFSVSKSEAIKEFQNSVKQIIKKKRVTKKRSDQDEKLKKKVAKKAKRSIKLLDDTEPPENKTISREIKAGNTIFQIESLDDLSKPLGISDKITQFRQKHLGKRLQRESANAFLRKRIKRQVANRKSTKL